MRAILLLQIITFSLAAFASLRVSPPPFVATSYPPVSSTSGLKLYLDAAKANGTGFPGAGTPTNWVDMSGAGLWSSPTITGFAGTNEGWIGNGSTGNPYALNVVTTASSTMTGNTNFGITGNAARTIGAWVMDAVGDLNNDPGSICGFSNTQTTGTLFWLTRSLANNNKFGLWGFTHDTTTTITSNDGAWHLTVGTYDGAGNAVMYIDGVSRGTLASTSFNTSDVFRIGQGSLTGIHAFLGEVATIFVYNRAISSSEVTTYFNNTKHKFGF